MAERKEAKTMKEINTQEMTEKEIAESLKLFSKLLKRNGYGYQHANPIKENCYISSSDIIGIYFPNSVIEHPTHKNYNLTALSKVDHYKNTTTGKYYLRVLCDSKYYYFVLSWVAISEIEIY